jgi:hypothetical protein
LVSTFYLQSKPLCTKWASPLERRQRLSAIECWYAFRDGEDAKLRKAKASQLFRKLNKDNLPAKPARYISDWVQHLESYGTLSNLSPAGPKRRLPKSAVRQAIELLYEGYERDGRQLAYTSMSEALEHNSGLKRILSRYSVSADTLLRRMQKLCPTVRKRLLKLKRELTPEQQARRLTDVQTLLRQWPVDKLQRVFWIDAATIIIRPKGIKVYLPPGHRALVFADPRLQQHSTRIQKLKFYICVNAILGPVALVFTSGTTDMQPAGNWEVSVVPHLPALGGVCVGGHLYMSGAVTLLLSG